jgi:long-chain acyl-CoA synthetase
MATLNHAANTTPVERKPLTELFLAAVDRFPETDAFRYFGSDGVLQGITHREALGLVRRVASALEAHGVTRGDRAAILSENRPEWALADFACLCAGVVDVPIYPTLPTAQVAYVLRDSGAKLLFASTAEQMQKAVEAMASCPQDVRVVVFDAAGDLPDGVVSWEAFLEAGAAGAERLGEEGFRARALQAGPDDVATILYTSGTTGDPKGVMLTHGNVGSNVLACTHVLAVTTDDVAASFLPLSHILERMVDYLFFHVGCVIAYPRSILTVVEDMQVIRPTVAVSVPRLYEKIYNGVMEAHGLKRRIIEWAVGVADRAAEARLSGGKPSGILALQYGLADRLVFTRVRAAVGGRMRFFVSGGAPLAPALNRFFYSIGLKILEGYGLTETSPVTNVNTEADFRIGTVGKAVPGTEIRIADDGEVLVRGPQVMKGYYNRPRETTEVIDAEGWFHTGDIGELDEDGFLRITDRKKDLIVTAGGKNVAPQPIENRLKANPLVEQAVLIGDRRKFVALLMVPNFVNLEAWARERGLRWGTRADLIELPEVVRHVEEAIAAELKDLASYERPKKIALLEHEFSIQNGLLTPTLKVKRRVIQDRLKDVIDELYGDEAVDAAIR